MHPKVVVSVCTVNYLAHAKGVADSMLHHNPDYKMVIGLIDKPDNRIDLSTFAPHLIVPVHELNLPEFAGMQKRYNINELNCALKTFFVRWALDKFQPEFVFFLDVDMLVFNSFLPLENWFKEYSILITPHITKPFPVDDLMPVENNILKTGMFNAGFFGVKNDETGNLFINWWRDRMVDKGFERPKDGLNSDQNWLNFAPFYFDKVKVVEHPGCNVAYWNLHERTISKNGSMFLVNDEPLLLYHYSGYSVKSPGLISKHQTRYSLENNAVLQEIFSIYHQTLLQNGYEALYNIPSYYTKSSSLNWLKKLRGKKK